MSWQINFSFVSVSVLSYIIIFLTLQFQLSTNIIIIISILSCKIILLHFQFQLLSSFICSFSVLLDSLMNSEVDVGNKRVSMTGFFPFAAITFPWLFCQLQHFPWQIPWHFQVFQWWMYIAPCITSESAKAPTFFFLWQRTNSLPAFHVPLLPFVFPSFPVLFVPLSLHPFRSRPPKYGYGVWGSAVSSPSGVWGKAPADKWFGAYWSQKEVSKYKSYTRCRLQIITSVTSINN